MSFEKQIDAEGIKTLFSADLPIFVFGDGTIVLGDKVQEPLENGAYDACYCPISNGVLTIGDNATITRTRLNGKTEVINQIKGGFADYIVSNSRRSLIAVAASRHVFVIDLKTNQTIFEFEPPMSPNCISFDVAGDNLVVGHGKGMTIYDLKTDEPAIDFPAAGGVYAAQFAPDLRFIVASTGEPALVGWRLLDGVAFRMAGYPTRPNSLVWLNEGMELVTSGGPVAVIWPFEGREGPMGKRAQTFQTRIGVVSCADSAKDTVALGYIDGGVDVFSYLKGDFHHIGGKEPDLNAQIDLRSGNSRISSIAVSKKGNSVAWIAEDGCYGFKKLGK